MNSTPRITALGCLLMVLLTATPLQSAPSIEQADTHFQRGIAANRSGHLIEAVTQLSKAIALQPDLAMAHYQRGLSFRGIGNTRQAIQDFERAVELGATAAEPYWELLAHYRENHQPASALHLMDQFILAVPEQALGAHWTRAELYLELGQKDTALATLRALTAQVPAEDETFHRLLTEKIQALQSAPAPSK